MTAYRGRRPLGDSICSVVAWLGFAAVLAAAPLDDPLVRRVPLLVRETAGIRRFGYPVGITIRLTRPTEDTLQFRLLDEQGKPIPAQFSPRRVGPTGVESVVLDFNTSLAPLESRRFVMEYGVGVLPLLDDRAGIRAQSVGDAIQIATPGGGHQYVVPRDPRALLRRVFIGKAEYLRADGTGLLVRLKKQPLVPFADLGVDGAPPTAEIVKTGPLVVAVRGSWIAGQRPSPILPISVELEFPLSKSWARVTCTVTDPDDLVEELGADVTLLVTNTAADPTLVDFGAGSTVYTPLRAGQSALLRCGRTTPSPPTDIRGPAWEVLLGPTGKLAPFVVATDRGSLPEGWAHVMDRHRATAIAVADFASDQQASEMSVDADGRLHLVQRYRTGLPVKTFRFWLHFVAVPVQLGAVTSPQSMLTPPVVELEKLVPRKETPKRGVEK